MQQNLIISGVGGQGILTIAEIIARSALAAGLNIKQSEVHGMAQRGGAVVAHLRISQDRIYSDLVPVGQASLVLAVEPLEALRQLHYLGTDGWVITNTTPVENIQPYPDQGQILDELRKAPHSVLVDADRIARKIGSQRAMNMVVLGAAARALVLPADLLRKTLETKFAGKGRDVVEMNLQAFTRGTEA